jgi:hypothetical protein
LPDTEYGGGRTIIRPALRWLENVEKDLLKIRLK